MNTIIKEVVKMLIFLQNNYSLKISLLTLLQAEINPPPPPQPFSLGIRPSLLRVNVRDHIVLVL